MPVAFAFTLLDSLRLSVPRFRGEVLKMRKVKRGQMGAYLCIASNDVPPAVSKRIILNVNCEDGSAVDEVSCAFSFVCFFDTKEKREGEAAECAMRPCAPINFEIGLTTPPLRDDKEPRGVQEEISFFRLH